MDKYFMWIHYERLHNHNKAKHNKTVCIFLWDILYYSNPSKLLHTGNISCSSVSETTLKNIQYIPRYARGFVVLCFVVVMQSFIMNSHEVFIHIHQGCFAGTGAIVRLPQCQWSKPDGYGKISQCITTAKHSKAKTVCIFLGIYCMWKWLHEPQRAEKAVTTLQSIAKLCAYLMGISDAPKSRVTTYYAMNLHNGVCARRFPSFAKVWQCNSY